METKFNYDQFRQYLNKNFSVEVSGKFKGAGSLSVHDAALLHHKMQRSVKHFSDGYRMHDTVMSFRIGGKTIKLYDK